MATASASTAPYDTLVQGNGAELRQYTLDPEWIPRMEALAAEVAPELHVRPEIRVFGRIAHQHRSVGFYSDTSMGYRYSGQIARSKPLTDGLRDLLAYVNTRLGASFNGILINRYESGEDYISAHSDDEKALDREAGVVSVSVGAVRTFRIREKSTKAIVANVPTEPTHLLQMWGAFQREYTHEIPAEKRVKGARTSFTFRQHTE